MGRRAVRIAIDIDSTLHHYWDVLADVARQRLGVELPYEEQVSWGITTIAAEDLRACVAETHREDLVLAGVPYPEAVETVRAWHEAGHFIHVTSHRVPEAGDATARWLEHIGLPFDDLRCDFSKVAHCVALRIDVLVDDSPVNLVDAKEAGIVPATLLHPWNEALCASDPEIVCARDWPGLRERLGPVLLTLGRAQRLSG